MEHKAKEEEKSIFFFSFLSERGEHIFWKKEVCFILRMENKNISVQLVEDLRLR